MGDPVTYLFVPGDRPERFGKALASGADRVILDLEDAVRPEAKAAARQAICESDLDWSRVVIRINAGAEGAEDHGVLRTVAAAATVAPHPAVAAAGPRCVDACRGKRGCSSTAGGGRRPGVAGVR